jgi:rod shape determining protein RodA
MKSATEIKVWRHFDLSMLLTTIVLVGFGLAMIYSATFEPEAVRQIDPLVTRHAAYAAVGLLFLVLMVSLDYRVLADVGGLLYVVTILALVAVLVLGRFAHGAQRWIDLGFFQFQPSEPAKLFMIAVLAKYFADNRERIQHLRHVLISLAIVAVPAGLTLVQPDLGTSLVYGAIWLGMAIVAGLRVRHFLYLVGAVAALSPILWLMMPPYMRERLTIFLNPEAEPLGAGYNVIQATISVGSGGLVGRGFLSGTQSQLHYLRVQYADFIFAVLAEELGFIGSLVLFGLFAFLGYRAMRAALISSEPFGRLLAVGILSMISFQFYVNVGMNIGLLPVTGIPLPFISFGGTSLVTLLAAIGVLESVVMRHRRFELF